MTTTHDKWAKRLQPLRDVADGSLLLHEIYASIQGESTYAGIPCTFVRTTACNLRCTYCDTRQAFGGGRVWTLEAIEAEIARLGHRLVELTGGEPLLQPAASTLMARLCDAGYTVLLETSGSLDIAHLDRRVVRIIDVKTPSSGEQNANLYANFGHLTGRDELKFVIGSRADYDWSRQLLNEHRLHERCTVLFGTVFESLAPSDLAAWIVADRLPVRMQLQLHKFIWAPNATGV